MEDVLGCLVSQWRFLNIPGDFLKQLIGHSTKTWAFYELEALDAELGDQKPPLPTFAGLQGDQLPSPPTKSTWGPSAVRALQDFPAEELEQYASPHVVYGPPQGSSSLSAAYSQLWTGLTGAGIHAILLDVCGGWHQESLKLLLVARELGGAEDEDPERVLYGYFISVEGCRLPAADRTQPAVHALMCERYKLKRRQQLRDLAAQQAQARQQAGQQQNYHQGPVQVPVVLTVPVNIAPVVQVPIELAPPGCSPQQQTEQLRQGLQLSPCQHHHLQQLGEGPEQVCQEFKPARQGERPQQACQDLKHQHHHHHHQQQQHTALPPCPGGCQGVAPGACARLGNQAAAAAAEQRAQLELACARVKEVLLDRIKALSRGRVTTPVPGWWRAWQAYHSSCNPRLSALSAASGLPAKELGHLRMARNPRDLHLRQAAVPFAYVSTNFEWNKDRGCLVQQELPKEFTKSTCDCDPGFCEKLAGRQALAKLREEGLQHSMEIFERSCGAGWGVRVVGEPIPADTYVMEYTGEYLSLAHVQAERREQEYACTGWHYLFDVSDRDVTEPAPSKQVVIDATHLGNVSRFVNHACEPNCSVVEVCFGRKCIESNMLLLFKTKRMVEPGEELTIAYMTEQRFEENGLREYLAANPDHPGIVRCKCGASSCRGVVLAENEASTLEGIDLLPKKRAGDEAVGKGWSALYKCKRRRREMHKEAVFALPDQGSHPQPSLVEHQHQQHQPQVPAPRPSSSWRGRSL